MAAIAEHDKLRGTRMKIAEPNTPYYNPQDSAELSEGPEPLTLEPAAQPLPIDSKALKGVPPDELRERLEILRLKQQQRIQQAGSFSDMSFEEESDEESTEEVRRHAKQFAERRKAHYNEFRVLKELRLEYAVV